MHSKPVVAALPGPGITAMGDWRTTHLSVGEAVGTQPGRPWGSLCRSTPCTKGLIVLPPAPAEHHAFEHEALSTFPGETLDVFELEAPLGEMENRRIARGADSE